MEYKQCQLRQWRHNRIAIEASKHGKKTLSIGRKSRLEPIRVELVKWIKDLHDKGVAVTYRTICIHASQLVEDFSLLSFELQYETVRRFCITHNLR